MDFTLHTNLNYKTIVFGWPYFSQILWFIVLKAKWVQIQYCASLKNQSFQSYHVNNELSLSPFILHVSNMLFVYLSKCIFLLWKSAFEIVDNYNFSHDNIFIFYVQDLTVVIVTFVGYFHIKYAFITSPL